ncbi:hypothetical protein GTY65_18615 [Streptomyces sp. SID8379]|uniref:hypothetical protein n=1 Tax=unclassified Streptomyces TaxID=2593676 RepID=UPI000379BDC3|nr:MULTISPECIES: hypothetical protein [unclassified Streptomyces]MYW66050.1 hypothetical protein [Streptomyces sp. SID8379]
MGVHVSLVRVTQRGTSSKGRRVEYLASVGRSGDTFAGLCARSELPMLRRVDPYNSQILTARDMPQFISELEATRAGSAGQDVGVAGLLDDLLGLARRCASQAGLEVHLDGD